jgi:hypothetical protein
MIVSIDRRRSAGRQRAERGITTIRELISGRGTQKARMTALANDERQSKAAEKPTCGAAQPGVMEWPKAEIDRTVQPTEAQRASLVALQAPRPQTC